MDATLSATYGRNLYAATMVSRPDYPRLTNDFDVDVCVVGGGLAGLTTAREIARRGWSVVLLEARRLARGASGRNTGFVLPGFAQVPEVVIARTGEERARELWRLSQAGLDYVRTTIEETGMPGVSPERGWLAVAKFDQEPTTAADVEMLRDRLGTDAEFWPTDKVRAHLKSSAYFQAIYFPTAFHMHPLNYALGLARAAEEAGVRIFEDTPAQSIDPAGVRKRVLTPAARVRAAHVVLAGNVHLDGLMPKLAGTLLPITSYVMATAPLGERLELAMNYRGAVSDTEWADNHYRPTQDNRLIWSGRMTTWVSNPRYFVRTLRADIARVYPQLGKVDVEFAWAGTLGNTVHRMPQIGELSPGLWVASGFGGHGLNTTALAGNLIARAIVEGDKTWTLFNPFELVWAGGVAGRALAQVSYWANRIKEGAAIRLGRWRASRRQERAAGAAPMAPPQADDDKPHSQAAAADARD